MEKNWAKVAQIVTIIVYMIIMIFDICVIAIDAQTYQDNKSTFVMTAYRVLIWVQSTLSLIILVGYVTLFTLFMLLLRRDKQRFGALYKQVIGFFSVMLFLMLANLVLNTIFYAQFEKSGTEKGVVAQERLVSITTYVHTGLEITFNIVLLSFLIS